MTDAFPDDQERFVFRGRLGQGGMGVVYRVYDREMGRDVALKTLARVDADAIYRLKREFRALAELSHPNLINLYELISRDETWFFTMELVQGINFLSWVSGALPPDGVTLTPSAGGSQGPTPVTPAVALAQGSEEATHHRAATPPAAVASEDVTRHRASAAAIGDGGPPAGAGPSEDATHLRVTPAPDFAYAQPTRHAKVAYDRLYDAMRQLTRGVQALHDAGKEHRDLKPGNVMVTAGGRVVLLDFGLTLDVRGREFYADTVELTSASGTPAYMAPERLAGGPATQASDWYSVGVMLYEALTSMKPHATMSEALAGGAVRHPRTFVPGTPDALSQLALDLLGRDPAARPKGPEILERLGDTGARQRAREFRARSDEALIGRARELAVLNAAFDGLAQGPSRTVQVRVQGASGYGKSALVRHFCERLLKHERAVVLAGRCYERESVPYKVFDSLIDSLTRYLHTLLKSEAAKLLPADMGALTRLFPSLKRVRAVAEAVDASPPAEAPDVHELSRRAAAALKVLFDRISAKRPLVLYVDDLQWGDADSSRLLADLMAPPSPPNAMLVVSYRSEDLNGPVLQQLLAATDAAGAAIHTETLDVGPLDESDALAIAARTLRTSHGADQVIREAHGSPFFIMQLAHYVADFGDEGAAAPALSLAEVLAARANALPDAARRLLTVIAVAGRPLQRALAVQAAQLDAADDALGTLRTASWVRLSGPRPTDTLEPYHDKIRETLAAAQSADATRAIHRRIAELLEQQSPQDPEALTVHWQRAGELPKAAGYALAAAAKAAQSLAFERAASLYELALGALPPGDPQRQAALVGRAEALKNAGRGPEAAKVYLEAAATAEAGAKLELNRAAFEQYLISGYLEQGREVAQAVLDSVGLSMPSSGAGIIASLLYHRARASLRGRRFTERAVGQVPKEQLTRADVCWSMAVGLSLIDNKLGAGFTARFLRAALDAGEPERLSRALALEAAHQAGSANFAIAEQLVAEAQALAEKVNSPHAIAFARQHKGWTDYFLGRYGSALECFDASSQLMRAKCTGVSWELSTSHMMSNWSLGYLGRWDELERRQGALMAEARNTGNLYRIDALSISAGVTVALKNDDAGRARAEMADAAARWTPSGFQVQHFFRLLMRGWVDLYAGDGAAYWQHLLEQWPALKRSLLLTVEDVRYRMHFIRGFAALAAPDDKAMRREALRAASVIEKTHPLGAKGIAATLRAAVAAREQDAPRAAKLLEAALADYQAAGMELFEAAASWRLGALELGDGGKARVHAARQAMERRGVTRPERVLELFSPGFPS